MSKNNDKNALEVLLSSKVRLKVLKFLFRNYPSGVGINTLADKIQEPVEHVRKEIQLLREIKLVHKR